MKRLLTTILLCILLAASTFAADEIRVSYPSSTNIYAILYNKAGQVWDPVANAWETYATGGDTADTYDIPLTEDGTASQEYRANVDTDIATATVIIARIRVRAGASPADTDTVVASQVINWSGTAELGAATDVTSVIGTALTEAGGAGRLAAAVSTWGNVATPAATAAAVNQTGDSYARLGAPAGASVSADIGSMRLQAGTVGTAGTAATFTLSSGFPAVANAYPRGTILTFTDATTGQSYAGQIRTYTAGRVVTMYQPLPAAPELGDAVIVWPFIWTPVGF